MALLLRRGDPLPALLLATGKLDVRAHAGRYWAIATGPQAVLQAAQAGDLPLVVTPPGALGLTAAQRLGAACRGTEPEPLVVLLDPAGTVVQSWADAPLPELLHNAQQLARAGGAVA